MSEPLRYSMLVQWSADDQAFLVTIPEWEGRVFGPVTHGETYEEAVKNGAEVLQLLVEAARESGEPLPEPRVFVTSAGCSGAAVSLVVPGCRGAPSWPS